MTEHRWVALDPQDPPGDPMVVVQCAANTYRGRRCRNRSPWLPASMLVDWRCCFHG